MSNGAAKMVTKTVTVEQVRDLAFARWRWGGFVVLVRGEVLREKRHMNERVFATLDAAIAAGRRARGAW